MFHNVETWSNITGKEMEELENLQRRIVRGMCEMMKTTPYLGLLAELGIWPVEQLIQYRQILLLHSIVKSDQGRFLKELIEAKFYTHGKGAGMKELKRHAEHMA